MSEGASFITINPATLDDAKLWSLPDLRALCKRVKLKGNGKREELVKRLQAWNRLRVNEGLAGVSELTGSPNDKRNWLPMNVEGANFALLGQNVVARGASPVGSGLENKAPAIHSPNYEKGNRRRNSTSPRPTRASASKNQVPSAPSSTQKKNYINFDVSSNTMAVSPTLLKPSICSLEREIIRKSHLGKVSSSNASANETIPPSKDPLRRYAFPLLMEPRLFHTDVHLILRASSFGKTTMRDDAIMENSREEDEDYDDDENNPEFKDLDENYVNAEAARNAEQNANIGFGGCEDVGDESSDESAQELWERAF